eukprot:CAMPEP_0198239520 /NCGR_PEP_ID=MMETSP1446-20131203/4904_1 /TAXON_ID=1461542 ORGANISM="Unidentified sp, Strain CCMP2111" /NCGR_SAMPLE_ID=MMETSP1446 /ASSEMBLY_ACC=CAM_ASM_001112 /LENGTH=651 /DNA_ID=CAMNT_0043922123 /DNA_START=118 /DNA_END=2073 /DNA_ORIENTATION=+
MKVTAADGVQVYEVSAGKRLPHWISERKRRTLSKDPDVSRRVDIVQDLEFPSGCGRVKMTGDGQYILATGLYPPQVRCFELKETSMKFMRVLQAEIVQFQVLSEDYSKLAFLCNDRSIAIHAKFGAYHNFRIPAPGRDLVYHRESCDLLACGSSSEIYRFNLHQGRFVSPNLRAKDSSAFESMAFSPAHGDLLACGGAEGSLECFDLRQRENAPVVLDVGACIDQPDVPLTCVRFSPDGLRVACGTGSGMVALFDLRSSKPLCVKDHMNDEKIVDIKFRHNKQSRILSADRRVIKLWDPETEAAETITSIEPSGGGVNDVLASPNDGLVIVGSDTPKMQVFFIPLLGPAPSWCSYLESVTEELDDQHSSGANGAGNNVSAYDDYRFITREDVASLGLTHLLGTPVLRAYMHGFFVDNRLYHKARSLSDPFAYDKYREGVVRAKIEEERQSRIASALPRKPRVNARLATKLMEESEKSKSGKPAHDNARDRESDGDASDAEHGEEKAGHQSLLDDERFASLFEDKRFKIDEQSEEYRSLHPNAPARPKRVLDDEEEDEEEDEEDGAHHLEPSKDAREGPRMFAAKSREEMDSLPLGARLEDMGDDESAGFGNTHRTSHGSKEMTFIPKSSADRRRSNGDKSGRRRRKMSGNA